MTDDNSKGNKQKSDEITVNVEDTTLVIDTGTETTEETETEQEQDLFFTIYPEFVGKVTENEVNAVRQRAFILFPVLQDGKTKKTEIAACMVTAHLIARSLSFTVNKEIGGAGGGIVSSASQGGVSVSYANAPYKDMSEYYFSTTPYGLEFLAWLSSLGGVNYVN